MKEREGKPNLDKLEVFHVFALNEFLDGGDFIDTLLVEAILQVFEVGDVVCLKLRIEFNFLDWNRA